MANKKGAKKRPKSAKKNKSLPFYKKLFIHPAGIFLLLSVGVLLVASTWQAKADSSDTFIYSVRGKVPAPALTEPAVITSLIGDHHYTSSPFDISGTCPDNSYVNLFRNGFFAGTDICNNGTFTILVSLTFGQNDITAQDFNFTDDAGPTSNPITIFYDQLAGAPNPSSTSRQPGGNGVPFTISSDFLYRGFLPGQKMTWHLISQGGEAPYAFTVKWTDGDEDTYAQKSAGGIDIMHSYSKVGIYKILVTAADSRNEQASLQLVAIVTNAQTLQFAGNNTAGPLQKITSSTKQWLWAIWPAYLTLVLMTVSFWLGEMQELKIIRLRKTRRR